MPFKVSLKIQHRDLGAKKVAGKWKLIQSRMAPVVHVGVLGRGNADVALYAAVNEYGTEDGRIPARPFMRPAFTSAQVKAAMRGVQGYLKDQRSINDLLTAIGATCRNQVISNINNHPPPPNAPSTIAAKGSSGTLVNTGRMKQSITYTITGRGRSASSPQGGNAAPTTPPYASLRAVGISR